MTTQIRYQPLIFPDGSVIRKKCCDKIPDSREKLRALGLPDDLSGKTFLDIGCAEGFFVIHAATHGAEFARGCDMTAERIDIARIVAKTWKLGDKTDFQHAGLYDFPPAYAADIVTCLAVAHHLHGGNHDTWQIISNPEKHADSFENMLRAVEAVAALTREMTCWEYCYEYDPVKPHDVDFTRLAKTWEEKGIYRKVVFRRLLQSYDVKDRAIYHAYK